MGLMGLMGLMGRMGYSSIGRCSFLNRAFAKALWFFGQSISILGAVNYRSLGVSSVCFLRFPFLLSFFQYLIFYCQLSFVTLHEIIH